MAHATVASAAELLGDGIHDIRIVGTIAGTPSIRLQPGVMLRGGSLVFGARGVVLATDNTLEDMEVRCLPHELAVTNDTSRPDLSTIALTNVRTTGQLLLLAERAVRRGTIRIERLIVEDADPRGRVRRPHGFGVDAMQGGLTVWNRQHDPDVVLHAEIPASRPAR
jgi:hypothetical protein